MTTQQQCPDCGVAVGQQHEDGCDVERCSVCGGQRISCDCEGRDPQQAVWAGEWPWGDTESQSSPARHYTVTAIDIDYDITAQDVECDEDASDTDIDLAIDELRARLPATLTFEVDAETFQEIEANEEPVLADMISDETGFYVCGCSWEVQEEEA